MIIEKGLVEKKILDHALAPVEIKQASTPIKVVVDVESIDEFLEIAESLSCTHVFFLYEFYNKDRYKIPHEDFSDYPKDFKKLVNDHNKKIDSLDFDKPMRLDLYVFYNGSAISVIFSNEWLKDLGYKDKNDQFDVIEGSYYAEEVEINKKKKEINKAFKKELREIILKDPTFRVKTNRESRFAYLKELLEEEEFKKYLRIFDNRDDIEIFLKETWMMYSKKI